MFEPLKETTLDWLGLPLLEAALLAALVAALLVLLFRRERRLVPGSVGAAISALRVILAVLVVALLAEPALTERTRQIHRARAFILMDDSQSMSLEDRDRPAWQKLREAIAIGLLPPGVRETAPGKAASRLARALEEAVDQKAVDQEAAAPVAPDLEEALREAEAAVASARPMLGAAACGQAAAGLAALRARSGVERREKGAALVDSLSRLQQKADELTAGRDDPAIREGMERASRLSRSQLATALIEGKGGEEEKGLAKEKGLAARLSRDLDVQVVSIGSATGEETNLGDPLLSAATSAPAEELAFLFLVSDGRHNHGRRPEDAARILQDMKVPVFTVSVGPGEAPRDVAIEKVELGGQVFAGESIEGELVVSSHGFPPGPVALKIHEGNAPDGKVVQETAVDIAPGATRIPLELPAGSAGRRKLTAVLSVREGEASEANNRKAFWVEVREDKAKVLSLEHRPRWQHRYLESLLSRDANTKLETHLLVKGAGGLRLPDRFPRDRSTLFEYDVILIGDVDPSVFSREMVESLQAFVSARGNTIAFLAGPKHLPRSYRGTGLEELIPVDLSDAADEAGASLAASAGAASSGFTLHLTRDGERSGLTSLLPSRERNRDLWPSLPAMLRLYSAGAARPAATVLARAVPDGGVPAPEKAAGVEAGPPVLVTTFAGAGRVVYVAVDETWRWRYRTGDTYFRRFWEQVLRWATANRLPEGDGFVRLGTDDVRYDEPATAALRAIVRDAAGNPVTDEWVDALIAAAGAPGEGREGKAARRVRLKPVPGAEGIYQGAAEDLAAGEYRVTLDLATVPEYSGLPLEKKASAGFVVDRVPSRELCDVTCDETLLREVARITGGEYLPLGEAQRAADLAPRKTYKTEVVSRTQAWSFSWWIAGIFAAALAAEWIARKLWDLV